MNNRLSYFPLRIRYIQTCMLVPSSSFKQHCYVYKKGSLVLLNHNGICDNSNVISSKLKEDMSHAMHKQVGLTKIEIIDGSWIVAIRGIH